MSLGDDLRRAADEADRADREITDLVKQIADLEEDVRLAEEDQERLRVEGREALDRHSRRARMFVMRNDREALYRHMAAMNGADEAIAILKAAAGDV